MAKDITFYLIDVDGCVDPSALGPYDTCEERDKEAKRVRARQKETDALFWADVVPRGTLKVGAYTAGFLNGTFDT